MQDRLTKHLKEFELSLGNIDINPIDQQFIINIEVYVKRDRFLVGYVTRSIVDNMTRDYDTYAYTKELNIDFIDVDEVFAQTRLYNLFLIDVVDLEKDGVYYDKENDMTVLFKTSQERNFDFTTVLEELGKDPELDLTVNALRKRVGFNVKLTSSPATDPKLVAKHPIIKGTNADLIREIRRERRVELFGEGLRYADLMRWGCGERLVAPKAGMMLYTDVYTPEEIAVLKTEVGTYADGSLDVYGKRVTTPAIFESSKHYLFSLPLNEMALNPKLKPNNPGWGD